MLQDSNTHSLSEDSSTVLGCQTQIADPDQTAHSRFVMRIFTSCKIAKSLFFFLQNLNIYRKCVYVLVFESVCMFTKELCICFTEVSFITCCASAVSCFDKKVEKHTGLIDACVYEFNLIKRTNLAIRFVQWPNWNATLFPLS